MSERKPIIPHLLVSGLAATALIGLWIGSPLDSSADAGAEAQAAALPEPSVVAPAAAAIVQTAPEVKVALATTADVTRAEMAPAAAPKAPTEDVTLVEVPDLKRMSAWEARKQLKKAGLGFVFKDGRRRVHHEDYDFYRVGKQSLSAGERVAAGTKVTLQVKERRIASGY